MSDSGIDELIYRYCNGDKSAFEDLARAHVHLVVALAKRLLKDEHEALDAAQEVFIAAQKALKDWRGESSLFTWLYRTTYQVCSNRLRKRVPIPLAQLPDKAAQTPETDAARNAEIAEALAQALVTLPERRKEVFLLRHEEALPLADIARRLGISTGAAKSHLHKALSDLRDEMKKRGIF